MAIFLISGTVSGTWSMLVEAETEADARMKANTSADSDDFVPDIEEVTDLTIDYVSKTNLKGRN